MKFKPSEAYAPEPVELTPNRRTLAELLDARESAMAESTTLSARIAKLDRARAEIAPLESELIALNNVESLAALAWSEADGDTPPPVTDVAKRTELEGKLATARAAANAADGATRSVSSQVERVNTGLGDLAPRISQVAGFVVLDEMESLIPELREAVAAVEAVKARIVGAREVLMAAAERLPADIAQPIFAGLERFDNTARPAATPVQTSDGPARAVFAQFAAALQHDATATMESQS